jgi:restriction endonuclease S subunit
MKGNINRIACGLAVLLMSAVAVSEELVVEFSGTGNRTTAEFKVEAPWILDWIINSDYDKMVSFDLDLVDGKTGVLVGNIIRAKALGNGVRMFNSSGTYRFRINASFIRWNLRVKALTPEEAELYTPK